MFSSLVSPAPQGHFGELAPPLPQAVVDLSATASLKLVQGSWAWQPATLVATEFPSVGPDRKPSGPTQPTHDVSPRGDDWNTAHEAAWQQIAAETLEERRSSGLSAQGWYRLQCKLPQQLGSWPTTHATVVLELVVDDYAEVWVNGKLPLALGARGAGLVSGWNAPNRVVLTQDAQAGQTFDIAIFAANAPLSAPPRNYVWIRSATLDFYEPGRWNPAERVACSLAETAPGLTAILGSEPVLERVASGFEFAEGPVWHADGYLLFSDPNANTIYRWSPLDGTAVWRPKSGYKGVDIGRYRQSGSNGLAFDSAGRLYICEHGNRRLTRLEKNGSLSVLAERYEGKRLNSPNDVAVRSDGVVYFTDPPFGLPGFHQDPARELDFCGVYAWTEQGLLLVNRDLQGPNGVALSPDEKFLYVGNWDPMAKLVLRQPVLADGRLGPASVFCDLTQAEGEEAIDGVEVDRAGNVFVSGPGGMWIYSAEGALLGRLTGPELPANFAFGDADRKTLYLAARSGIYRLRTQTGAALLP